MASPYTAQWDGICSVCQQPIVGYKDSGAGDGHAIHWARGSSAKTGLRHHCAKGCCTCNPGDEYGLQLRAPVRRTPKSHSPEGDQKPGGEAEGGSNQGNSESEGQGAEGGGEVEQAMNVDPEIAEFLKRMHDKALQEARAEAQVEADEVVSEVEAKAQAAAQQARQEAAEAKAKLKVAIEEAKEAKRKAEEEAAPRVVVIRQPDGSEQELAGHHHENFDLLLGVARAKEYPCKVGLPGGGKSHAAMQLAEALGVKYRGHVSLHPLSSPSEIYGLIYGGGDYRGTVVRMAVEHGGVVCVEEIFNSSPQIQARMNSSLASGIWDFPDRQIRAHDDCYFVFTDNTYGFGGDWLFPERRSADAAFRDRLTFIDWPYDERLEMKLGLSKNKLAGPWVKWVQAVRAYCETQQKPIIVSPRASMSGANLLACTDFPIEQVAEMTLFKGVDAASIKEITNYCPLPDATKLRAQAKAMVEEIERRTLEGGDEAEEREDYPPEKPGFEIGAYAGSKAAYEPEPDHYTFGADSRLDKVISEVKDGPDDRPEQGKTYSLLEISKGKTWAEAEVRSD